jgi:hypothetical protein
MRHGFSFGLGGRRTCSCLGRMQSSDGTEPKEGEKQRLYAEGTLSRTPMPSDGVVLVRVTDTDAEQSRAGQSSGGDVRIRDSYSGSLALRCCSEHEQCIDYLSCAGDATVLLSLLSLRGES